MESRAGKGWGWGDKSFPVESRPALWAYLRERLKLPTEPVRRVVPLEAIRLPPSLLSPAEIEELREHVGEGGVTIEDRDRIAHAVGRGYRDLVRLRSGDLGRLPAAIVFPEDEDRVPRGLVPPGR